MNIFVLTSHSETYGMVTIEAMASGLPVVVTNTGGSPGLVSNNMNGLLVPPQEPNALADALCLLLDKPDRAKALAVKAREHAIATYSYQSQCDQLEKLFADLTYTR
jgi:glycosyltransferase involved in cell wall biosynthesis